MLIATKKAENNGLKTIPVIWERDGQEIETTFGPGALGFVPRIESNLPVFE